MVWVVVEQERQATVVFILITLDIVSCLVIDHVSPHDKALQCLEPEIVLPRVEFKSALARDHKVRQRLRGPRPVK